MITATVEHGAIMDIDLTAGLAKLKTAAKKPPVLEAALSPKEAFTAVLAKKKPGPHTADSGDATPPIGPLPLALPQEPKQAISKNSAKAPPLVIRADTPKMAAAKPQTKGRVASELPKHQAEALPLVPMPIAAPVPVTNPVDEKPVQEKASGTQPRLKGASKMPAALPLATIPAASKAKPLLQDKPLSAPWDKQNLPEKADKPIVKPADLPQPARPAKAPMALASIGASPVDTAPQTLSDMPFSLKIESQPMVVAQAPHADSASATAPVASQITENLPHLLSKAEKQTVELRLDPPELGRVTIHLTTHDQTITAHVVADRVDTVDLMRRHAEVLTATLARAGFAQTDLSFQQGKGQSQQGGFQHFQGLTDDFTGADQAVIAPTPAGHDGRLDIRL